MQGSEVSSQFSRPVPPSRISSECDTWHVTLRPWWPLLTPRSTAAPPGHRGHSRAENHLDIIQILRKYFNSSSHPSRNEWSDRMLQWVTIKFFFEGFRMQQRSHYSVLHTNQPINPTHICTQTHNSRTHCKTVHSFINNHNDGIIKINNRKMKSKTSSDVMTL